MLLAMRDGALKVLKTDVTQVTPYTVRPTPTETTASSEWRSMPPTPPTTTSICSIPTRTTQTTTAAQRCRCSNASSSAPPTSSQTPRSSSDRSAPTGVARRRRTPITASLQRAPRTRSAPSAPTPTGRCGSAPVTPPNPHHICTKLYAKGFRNPFRFTLRGGGLGPAVGERRVEQLGGDRPHPARQGLRLAVLGGPHQDPWLQRRR